MGGYAGTEVVAAPAGCGCSGEAAVQPMGACGCSRPATASAPGAQKPRVTLAAVGRELVTSGRQLVVMFAGFAFIGYFLNGLIPASWVTAAFGSGQVYSVPLAATLGLPLYLNSETSLPLVRALLENGMSQGAAMAFMIAGAGTSIGALGGALTIARWRVVALVVGVLWAGAIACGYAFDLAVRMGVV